MKLNKLNAIAHNALHLGEAFNPLTMLHITLPCEIQIDLLTGKFTPELNEDDSLRKHYEGVINWFHQEVQKEGIPIDVIEEAKIIIYKNTDYKCIIKAGGRMFGYQPKS